MCDGINNCPNGEDEKVDNNPKCRKCEVTEYFCSAHMSYFVFTCALLASKLILTAILISKLINTW